MAELKLYQFNRSHYNERARWALDYKGLAHTRMTVTPGEHAGIIPGLTGGGTSVPVLMIDEEVIQGSGEILDRLEMLAPTPALMPEAPEAQAQVRELEAWFNEPLGVDIRTAIFAAMFDDPHFVATCFGDHLDDDAFKAFDEFVPAIKPIMEESFGFGDPSRVAQCHQTISEALDKIASAIADTGYMVGDAFTRADLTAAALTCLVANPDHIDMKLPEPLPQAVQDFLGRYEDHPATQWISDIYAKHRPAPLESA